MDTPFGKVTIHPFSGDIPAFSFFLAGLVFTLKIYIFFLTAFVLAAQGCLPQAEMAQWSCHWALPAEVVSLGVSWTS